MSSTSTKTLPKRIPTKHKGIFYKEVQQTTIDDHGRTRTRIADKVYIIRYRDNGKERLVTLGKYSEGIREAYCKTKLNEFVVLAHNGELPPQVEKRLKKDVVTFDYLADVYFESLFIIKKDKEKEKAIDKEDFDNRKRKDEIIKYRLSMSGKKQFGRYVLHIRTKYGSCDIHSLTRVNFKALRDALKDKGKAPKTVNGILALARAIINHSIKENGLIINNPASKIDPLQEDDERDRFLSIEEVRILTDAVKDDVDLYHFVQMALTTGARLESVLNINKKDIDLKHDKITIKDFKNGKSYMAFFSDDSYKAEVLEVIEELGKNDKFIDVPSRTVQRKLKPILDRLFNDGLDTRDAKNRVVIHSLRHTFASQLAMAGVPILTIKNLMNHGTIDMTMRYAKLAPDSGKDVVKGLYDG